MKLKHIIIFGLIATGGVIFGTLDALGSAILRELRKFIKGTENNIP